MIVSRGSDRPRLRRVTDRPRTPRTVDALVAGGGWLFAALALVTIPLLDTADDEIVLAAPGSLVWWLTLVTITAQAVVLTRARSAPRPVLLSVAALPMLLAVSGPGAIYGLTAVATVLAVYLVTLVLPPRDLRIVLPVVALTVVVGESVNAVRDTPTDLPMAVGSALLQAVAVVGLPLVIALAVAARREARSAHRGEEQALVRERDALVQAAVADERTAMARELHDIAAHHMSGIAIMSAAIARQIDTDPEAAKRSVQQVREQSTAVLDDLRRLVGLLREDDGEATRSVETLASLHDLVASRRDAGLTVELLVPGGRTFADEVGPLAQLVAYRMVQEALTNAVVHAPGAACVVEIDDTGDGTLMVRVLNGAPTSPVARARSSTTGFGLVGMRERAALVGADLAYGSTVDGGWEVRLTLPRDSTRPQHGDPHDDRTADLQPDDRQPGDPA